MTARDILFVLLATLLLLPRVAVAQEPQADEISRLLFKTYLDGPRKINTSTVMAASHLVAEQGRVSGFWKEVLAELRSGDEHSEVNCVRILGNMLATDAAARDAIRRQKEEGEVSAWIPSVHLGPEVVAELLERGQKADRFRTDHYTVALARARVPEAREFFQAILSGKTRPKKAAAAEGAADVADAPISFHHLDGTRFHAAVGLAQLGDVQGIDWLVANSDEINGHVSLARPYGANPGGNLGSCCVAALQQLSGKRDLTAKAEWQAWSRAAGKDSAASHAVQFMDP